MSYDMPDLTLADAKMIIKHLLTTIDANIKHIAELEHKLEQREYNRKEYNKRFTNTKHLKKLGTLAATAKTGGLVYVQAGGEIKPKEKKLNLDDSPKADPTKVYPRSKRLSNK